MMVGCGNSELSRMIYDINACHDILSIDTNETVIAQMIDKHNSNGQRPGLIYKCLDVLNLHGYIDASISLSKEGRSHFSCVIDKGTLDALHTHEGSEETVEMMFQQIDYALQLSGRYIVITLAQAHILQSICAYFIERKPEWVVHIHQITSNSDQESSRASFPLPVFVFVFVKLRCSPDHLPRLSIMPLAQKQQINMSWVVNPTELSARIKEWIKMEQELCLLRHELV
ncbi:unnamed protein product [Protopolystoma xenopodis]|uniref:Methyltransferase domain-containing protein n=1 Tax=Protopolystoma xenopodis TaxID=117903 RepID=A0A448X688_9PLAT|nr:unnamed protein product [Protopolystoma xenopodis]